MSLLGHSSCSWICCLCGNDTVTKLPRLAHEARRLSDGHLDGVAAASYRVDAIDAIT